MAEAPIADDIHTYEYKVPAIPAYIAFALNYSYFWMVPYWIAEFILFCVKDRLVRNGVGTGDWVILFLWVIAQPVSTILGISSIKQGSCQLCSPFWFYILIGIISIFFTIYIASLVNTILLLEIILSVITIIIQIILFFGTSISFFIQMSPPKSKSL
ncbi:hypothetical protein TRFO_02714 [Tritrichomonas foetus]|uniref:Transmembrane protein n=1 Tax=Tritrichomonas foetus TaxID=1144522 RepID=A0A1J4KZ67_9EUKA|nr:hypothetical protein TRFO_02714 [Tritrichomonas foetus]|eukprot:OHT16450.1 hypothetical protein TRFO_02714 [Tritrichomonas foetus]